MAQLLEPRVLLSANLSNLKTGPLRKIGDTLASLYQQYDGLADSTSTATADSDVNISNGDVQIQAYANSNGNALAKSLTKLHAVDVQTYGTSVTASFPVSELRKLAALLGLRFAEPSWAITNAGSVTSQGDIADEAAAARSSQNLTGAGVMVGILSDSFNTSNSVNNQDQPDTYATDVASGDLPAGVQIITDSAGGTDEGRAMAQVIYDSAPGVNFAFETAEGGQNVFAAHIDALAAIGAKVIVDDVTYPAEPMFQDGVVAQAVENVIGEGVSYFSAAGNEGSDAYASAWQAGPSLANGAITSAPGAPHFYGGTTFNFGTPSAVNDMNSFTLGVNQSIFLSFQWDSPYFSANGKVGSPNDMDAYVLSADGSQVVGGSATYNIGGDPTEVFEFTNTTGINGEKFNLMLTWNNTEGGPAPGYLKYVDFDGQASNWEYSENSGTIFGHANAAGVISVGAASYLDTPAYGVNPPIVESYSSTGTTPIFFNTAGTRLTTSITRQSPTIIAPDNVDNTFFGADTDGDSYPNFTGTSASAAEAAAVGALLLQENPHLTPAQIATALEISASNYPTPNSTVGYGLINANAAVASTVGTVSGTVFQDNNGNGVLNNGEPGVAGVTVYYDANNNGVLDSGDISTTTNSQGMYVLNNVPEGTDVIRDVVPAGFVATITQTLSVAGGSTNTGVNLGVFNTDIINSSNGASYMLEADASTPANDDIYIGSTLTYSVPRSIVPALTFNLTGGNSTLTVNYVNGDPNPTTGGVDFIAGSVGSTTGNNLIVTGSNNADNMTINDFLTFPGGDAINIENVQNVNVAGNGGNDSLTLGQSLTSTVTYNGGTGTNTLTYNGAADANTVTSGPPTDASIVETINVANTQVSDTTSVANFSNVQILNVIANLDGDDTVVNLSAGAPTLTVTDTGIGQTINLNSGLASLPVAVITSGTGDILDIASGYTSPVTFTDQNGQNELLFNGTTGTNTTTITSTTVTDSVSSVTYSGIGFLTVDGIGSSNTFNINSSAPAATVTTTINGGTSVNILNVNTALANSGATTFFNGGTNSGVQNTLNINAGAFQFAGDPQSTSANLTINDNSSLIFEPAAAGTGINARNVTNLNLGASSTAAVVDAAAHTDRAVLVLNTLSINPSAKLDAGGNDIIVHNGSLSQLTLSLSTGYHNGSWNGDGIASSTAQHNTSLTTALGIILNTLTTGGAFYSSFDGQHVVSTDVLIKYTYYGDANLDGMLNASDYSLLDNGFNFKATGWINGDFNYDTVVNSSDYLLMDNAYNSQTGPL